jgi:hypothetical protein
MAKFAADKNTILSLILALVVVLILFRATPPFVDSVVELKISKNRTPIHNLHQQRNVELQRSVMVDKLDLSHGNRFSHPKLGALGFSDNFFVDVDEDFMVKKTGNYQFNIGSDDGFAAKVDGNPLCEHLRDRPFSVQVCRVYLKAGEHRLELSYFQGFGNSGLSVEYKKVGDKRTYYFGENSPYFSFE